MLQALYDKMKNLLSPKGNFRQSNSLVISFINTLISRNFCQISVRVNFRNFHTVRGKLNSLAYIADLY